MFKWRVELVEGWREAHKWFSTQSMAVSAAILATWALLPDEMKASLPESLVMWLGVLLLVLGIGGRLIKQTGKKSHAKPRRRT